MSDEITFAEWLATCPPHVRVLAEKFPPGSETEIAGKTWWLFSYCETTTPGKIMLRFVSIDPSVDWDGANAAAASRDRSILICADHFTEGNPS